MSEVNRGRRQILAWGAAMAGATLAPGVTLFDLAHGRAPSEPPSVDVCQIVRAARRERV